MCVVACSQVQDSTLRSALGKNGQKHGSAIPRLWTVVVTGRFLGFLGFSWLGTQGRRHPIVAKDHSELVKCRVWNAGAYPKSRQLATGPSRLPKERKRLWVTS